MPLSFLTADPAFEATDGTPLPHDDRDRWHRPYRPGPYRVGAAAVLLLLASYVLLAGVVIATAGTPAASGVVFGIAAAVIAGALRLLRVGVWVSSRGLRRVGFLSTRTVPWSRVDRVRRAQQPVRWLGLPRTVQGQALMLFPGGGGAGRPLLTTHDADFLARGEAFRRASRSVEGWAAEYAPR
ncbi:MULTISPECIES: hypothetical protein [unclassified Streptomyces]|uniref:hypothetical protein n=1 Tax=unclassified Streptomyces TaxID=2593676 RepID=UPI001906CE39|nr:hypothetical protein [Streptomyces sp. HSG2]